jgi:hypothetical protein
MRTGITVFVIAIFFALGAYAPAQAAAPCKPAQLAAAKHKAKVLSRRVVTLRAQNKRLTAQLATAVSKLDETQGKLEQAQGGVGPAISTMVPEQIWPLLSIIGQRFSTARYSRSYFSNGSDYQSWTFTYCGFC